MPNFYKILMSPAGRMGRRDYLLGLAAFTVAVLVFNFILARMGNSVWAFLISLPFPFIVLHMTYCVYGKRLHDMGRSFWPLTAMICALLLVMIGVMLSFGGSEYFSEFAQYDSKNPAPPEVAEAIRLEYETRMVAGLPWLTGLMSGIIGLFTLWLVLSKTEPATNQYGPPASEGETFT